MKKVFQVSLFRNIIERLGVSPIFTVVCDREEDIPAVLKAKSGATDPAMLPVLRFIEQGLYKVHELPLDQDGVY